MEVVQQETESIRTEGSTARARTSASVLTQIVASAFAMLIAPYLGIRVMAAIVDPDIWWHIRTGDWIVQHHTVPRFAIFSQYSDRAWVAYSWIFEVLMSAVHHFAGLPGLPAALICIQVLVSAVLLITLERVGPNFWISWFVAVVTMYAIYGIPLRPMAFTFLFFMLELFLIFETDRTQNDKLLLWLGPLFLVWANTHVQFVYGLSVLGLYVATRAISTINSKSLSPDSREFFPVLPVVASGCAVLAACLGPNGLLPYRAAVDYMIHPTENRGVTEMMAMNFRSPEHYVRLLLLIAAAFAAGRFRRRNAFRPLLLAMTAAVSFRFMRDAWFMCIAAAFVLVDSLRSRFAVEAAQESKRQSVMTGYAPAVALAILASFAIATRQGLRNSEVLMMAMDRVYPIRATEFIRDSGLKGPMYNTFNWGGFLIFNLPQQPVSIDPRVNAYGDELVQQAFHTAEGVNWRTDPALARANFVILENWLPLASRLRQDANYKVFYEDDLAEVFVRREP